jgi:hypothetical protein
MKISFDKYSLKINEKRIFIRSGSFHYFRLPSRKLWKERLQLIKQAGLNTVDFYFPWNFHSPAEAVYDFSGIRDINYLMNLAEDLGLYIIARPGPYVCSEIDGGGFPGWLIAKRNVVLRCRKNGWFKYSPEYIKYVRQWFEQIVPRIAKHKNVILFQIENEYSSFAAFRGALRKLVQKVSGAFPVTKIPFRNKKSKKYLKELYQISRELGIKVPIFHNDLPFLWGICLDTEGRTEIVDIVATDDYSFFGQDWKKTPSKILFRSLDFLEKWLRPLNPQSPLFITELQGGWFDNWGGQSYEAFRKTMGPEHIDLVTRTALAQGITLFNYYMFCGGTNWGYLGSPDVYTSYDFGAPVSESGLTGPRYESVKKINRFIQEWESELCQTEKDKTVKATNSVIFYQARINPETETRFVFLRNLKSTTQKTQLNIWKEKIKIPSFSMPILIFKKDATRPVIIDSFKEVKTQALTRKKRKKIKKWLFANIWNQIVNDQNWQKIPPGQRLDFDSLGNHYGYGWYKTSFRGKRKKLTIDARHCCSIWLNRKLLASFDNVANISDGGPDFAETKSFDLDSFCSHGENQLVVLVESLGHKKNFEDDAKNPRGMVRVKINGEKLDWQFQPGLIPGELGLCPIANFNQLKRLFRWEEIKLPHKIKNTGVYLIKSTFLIKDVKIPQGLKIIKNQDKANIYLNDYLIGRYWEEKGPQRKFYLPASILKRGKNKLYLVLWCRKEKINIDQIYLETYG